ncbi:WD40-repeat-containing domain protein [Rhypophila decipiens]|uniref:WD40-repeat-containing domain protein n=1 Tax=Rhypophila decipiens TaxID=261697 RepID=A0AAN6YAS3_9PEZI|nr:WD40-repeat-containing domain protein [Rhypophila decipiens]
MEAYFKHVSKHLREVSLAVLPPTFNGEDDSSVESTDDSLRSSHSEVGMVQVTDLEVPANAMVVIELATKVASLCLEYLSEVQSARSDIERLVKHIENLRITAHDVPKLIQDGARLETLQKMREAVDSARSQLGDVVTKLEATLYIGRRAKAVGRVGLRALKWPFESKDVDMIIANLQRDQDSFAAALQIDQIPEILDMHSEIVLATLPVASGAAFDSHAEEHNTRCYPDTRTELLCQIREWANDPQAESIFWLNGMAGTGKSTISRTVATSFARDSLLGASFFFKRGEGDCGKANLFFSTIASQLVRQIPALVPSVRAAIDADPDVSKKALRHQFEKLILQPLGSIHRTTAIVIVIDALDGCDGEKDVKTIISLLAQANMVRSVRLRVFITSRPELPIRLGFKDIQGKYQGIALLQIPEPVVEQDISTFLGYELARIRNEYNGQAPPYSKLPLGWPGQDVIRTLAQMAVPLFISAATVCRFVEDKAWSNPGGQLKKILEYRAKTFDSELDKLDATYLPILDQLTVGRTDLQRSRILAEFRDVVGPIVLLAQPLPILSLARLLDIPPMTIHGKLNSLHSVLDIPSVGDAPVRLFHLSFRDFLVDPAKRTKNEFWIDQAKYHKTLAERCIQIMEQHLKRDICDLKEPGMLRSQVSQQTINAHLRPEVQYACQYWVYHLEESKYNIKDDDFVHTFLTSHLLHWLEALSLLGRLSDGVFLIRTLPHTAQPDKASDFVEFVKDAEKFIRSYGSIMERAPLQIYGSALIFSPTLCEVKKQQWKKRLSFIKSVGGIKDHWGAQHQTLEGHSDSVTALAFSPDGKTLTSSSGDHTIRLWDAATGMQQQTLKGHSDSVTALAFSPDGKTLASSSGDHTIWLWDAATGMQQQTLKGHSSYITALTFSPDGKTLASGLADCTIQLWDTATGTHQQTLEGHSGSVTALVFSPDGKTLVSSSGDNTIRLWDTATGAHQQTLEGHSYSVMAVAFSPDGKTLASGSDDHTIRLWDTATGALQQTLERHSHSVMAVAFSPDGKTLASGSADCTIRLWDTATGTQQQTLKRHSHSVMAVAFSPDGKTLASGSADCTIRLWDAATGTQQQTLEGHSHSVMAVTFSPDGKTLASGSADCTIRLWDAATGTQQQTLEGHSHFVMAVAFSPDGKTLVSGSADCTIRLWDAATGTQQQTLEGHSGSVMAVAFSSDGNSSLDASGNQRPVGNIHFVNGEWITRSGKNLLWLPPDYRPTCTSVYSHTLALGHSSGQVTVFQFVSAE